VAQLLALEYNIGLPPRTLNVNTVQNLDFCKLLYLPLARSCLNDYNYQQYDIYEVGSITHFSTFTLLMETQFAYSPPNWQEYRVMYLNLREDITVIRQRWSPPSSSTAGSCPDPPQSSLSQPPPPSYDFYRAPFADFPIIQSHVHPFCIIYNAGQKASSQTVLHAAFPH
jgi:hypothetical protein